MVAWFRLIIWLLRRRFRSHKKLFGVTAFALLAATTLVSASDVYSRALAESSLRHLVSTTGPDRLNAQVVASDQPLGPIDYQRLQEMVDPSVDSRLGSALVGRERYGRAHDLSLVRIPEQLQLTPGAGQGFLGRPFFLTGFEDHVTLVDGRWPEASPILRDSGVELEAVVGIGAATHLMTTNIGLTPGTTVYLAPFISDPQELITVNIVGNVAPVDPREEYWMGYSDYFEMVDAQDHRFAAPLYLREQDYLQGLGARYPDLLGDFGWLLYLDHDNLTANTADQAAMALANIETDIKRREPRARVLSSLGASLEDLNQQLTLARVPLFLFLTLVVAVMLYFLLLVIGLLARSWRDEAGLLRSRGASTVQMGGLLLLSDGILVAGAVALGPLLALGLSRVLMVDSLSPSGPNSVGLSSNMFMLAGGSGVLSLVLVLAFGLNPGRTGVVHFLRERAHPPTLPLVQRYYLDLAALGLIALIWWQISEKGGFVAGNLAGGDVEVEPTLLLGPVLVFVGVALLVMRLLPLFAGLVARTADLMGPAWAWIALRRVSREPLPHSSLVILLLLTAGLGTFAATFQDTLSQSQRDRALYSVGGDMVVRVGDTGSAEERLRQVPGLQAISPVGRRSVTVSGVEGIRSARLLTVDSATLAEASWFREDFANVDLAGLAGLLNQVGVPPSGVSIPDDAATIGLWMRFDAVGLVPGVSVRLRDKNGAYHVVDLSNAGGAGWGYVEAPIADARQVIEPPVHLISISVSHSLGAGAPEGSISIDDVSVSSALDPNTRAVVEGFEGLEGQDPWLPLPSKGKVADTVAEVPEAARTGETGLLFSWTNSIQSDARGALLPQGPFPLPAIGSATFTTGQTFNLEVDRLTVPLVIAEVVDYFPTLDPTFVPFVLVDSEDLVNYLDSVSTSRRGSVAGEYWVNLAEDADRAQAVVDINKQLPRLSAVIDSQMVVRNALDNPLSGGSWRSVVLLAIVVVTAAVFLALAFHGVVAARASRVDLVVMRALGQPQRQMWLSLVVERFLVALLGMGLGVGTGYLLAKWILAKIDTTVSGSQLVPPAVIGIETWVVGLTLGVLLAATIVATVLTAVLSGRIRSCDVLRTGQ